jgi:hypothetical protein
MKKNTRQHLLILTLLALPLLATGCEPAANTPSNPSANETDQPPVKQPTETPVETPATPVSQPPHSVTPPVETPVEAPAEKPASAKVDIWKKVEIDLTKLDKNGLIGPATGKRSLAYEFCIPKTAACMAEVKAIDPSIRFMRNSRGRIGAGPDQCLCIGETQKGYRKTLQRLATLDYIKRIIVCHFE